MAVFGSFALLIALALATYNLLAAALALRLMTAKRPAALSPERLAETARRAGIAGFIAVTAAAGALLWAIFANDFSISYVVEHSNRALPAAYKFSALWAGQEGSLLLWAWLLGGFGFLLRRRRPDAIVHSNPCPQKTRAWMGHPVSFRLAQINKLYACAGAILAGIQTFFLLLLCFPVSPFALLPDYVSGGPLPADGSGLNPLLQYPEMVLHPPLLYLGYVGFSIPFALALAALIVRAPGQQWLKAARGWAMASWLFLTLGIFLGMHWAYAVLGWGGYWSWDPVENSSLMPWLTATAFLHSVIMQERKGMMKSWNVWLIFSTFLLTLMGTMLTRGGLVSSVHAFAASPIGYWFLAFMAIVLVVCLFAYFPRRSHLKSEHPIESLVSRESGLLFGCLVLLAVCIVILWGTIWPALSGLITGGKITIGAAWYNSVAVPIGLFLLFLSGAGPLLPWRATPTANLRSRFLPPVIAFVLTLLVCAAFGVQPWRNGAFDQGVFYALLAFALAAGVIAAVFAELLRGAGSLARQNTLNPLAALFALIRNNTRRCGGYTVHIGVALAVVGLAGAAFNRSAESEMAVNDKISIGPYTLECAGFTEDSNANYDSEYVLLNVSKNGRELFQMTPEKRLYRVSEQPQSMVAIHSTAAGDLYVVFEGMNPDTGRPVIKAMLNPLVGWIWTGAALIFFGALVALIPRQLTANSGQQTVQKTAEDF
jgi:cytochrome c-type biogenesis protein CcmF